MIQKCKSIYLDLLNHWGRVMHVCFTKLSVIGSDNGLSPGRHQAIIWTNAGILLIWPLGTNYSDMLIEIHTVSFRKIHLKMLSAKWQPFCLSLNELKYTTSHCLFSTQHWSTLQWHHNECNGISNHRHLDCVLNRLFKARSKKSQSSASLAFVGGIHRWPASMW